MTYHVEIREIPPGVIASCGATTTQDEIGDTLTRVLLPLVYAFLEARGISPAGPPIAIYDEFAPGRVRFAGGVPVDAPFEGDDAVHPRELPGGKVVTTRHVGPYHGLDAAHRAVLEWTAAQGLRVVRPSWEVYPMPPGGEPDPARLVTEVFWPLG